MQENKISENGCCVPIKEDYGNGLELLEFSPIKLYLIAKKDVLSEQALNSKIHPAHFLLSTNVVSNKREGTK